jgi:hypothetical protein
MESQQQPQPVQTDNAPAQPSLNEQSQGKSRSSANKIRHMVISILLLFIVISFGIYYLGLITKHSQSQTTAYPTVTAFPSTKPFVTVLQSKVGYLPYYINCNPNSNTMTSEEKTLCNSGKYDCAAPYGNYTWCTLKVQYIPTEISCRGNVNYSQREKDLCTSGRYTCTHSSNLPDVGSSCKLKN